MELVKFRVRNYRNVIDSGPIDVSRITAFVGQNECGKSNLFEALYRLNSFEPGAEYDIDEDWPADDWGGCNDEALVCEATFDVAGDQLDELYRVAEKKSSYTIIRCNAETSRSDR